jgi:hypothetical protein
MTAIDNNTIKNVTITDARDQKPDAAADKKQQEKRIELTPEVRDKIHKRMFGDRGKDEPKEKAKPEAKKEVAEKKDDKPSKAADASKETAAPSDVKPEPEEKPKAEPKAEKPEVDYERLAKSVAAETAKAMRDTPQPAKEQPAAKPELNPDDEVPAARRRDLDAVKYLDANNPRYKGKLDAYRKFAKEEDSYISKWERDNPGRRFDPEDSEHEAWYDKHEPEIDPEDISEARIELTAERKAKSLVEKETGETRKEIERIRLERDVERAEALVPTFATRSQGMVIESMGAEIAEKLGKLKPNETLEDSDPAAHKALVTVLPSLGAKTRAAATIFGTNGRAYNDKDATHKEIAQEALAFEADILAGEEKSRTLQDGRTYAKLDDWANMSDAQKAKHWTIDANLMTHRLGEKAAKQASEIYKTERESLEKLARAYGYVKADGSKWEQKRTEETPEEAPATTQKPISPSTSTRTVISPGTKVEPKTSKDGGDVMLNKMFRR